MLLFLISLCHQVFRHTVAICVELLTFALSLFFWLNAAATAKPQLPDDAGKEAGASDSHVHNRLIFLMPEPEAVV